MVVLWKSRLLKKSGDPDVSAKGSTIKVLLCRIKPRSNCEKCIFFS